MAKFSAQIETAYSDLAIDTHGKQLLCQKSSFDKLLEDLSSIHSSTSDFSLVSVKTRIGESHFVPYDQVSTVQESFS